MADNTEKLAFIEVNKIQRNRFQPRVDFKQKEIEELAESIDQQGLVQPIIVRPIGDGPEDIEYELVAGERRLRAVRDVLGKTRIRAIVREQSDNESMESALIENIQREQLNAMEESEAIHAMMEKLDLTQQQVAKRLGKSRAYISNIVRLRKLPDDIKTLVKSKMLDAWGAMHLITLDEKHQLELADKAAKQGWTQERIKQEVAKVTEKGDNGEGKKKASKRKPRTNYLVLVELDSAKTLKEFTRAMEEEGWNCWTGADAKKMVQELKEEKVPEEGFLNEDKQPEETEA